MFFKSIHRYKKYFFIHKHYEPLWTSHIRSISTSKWRQSEWRPSYFHMPGKRPLVYDTVGSRLEKAAHTWPNRPWLISHQEKLTMTFSEVLEEVDRLAAGLLESGLQSGDKLGICSPNSVRWITTMMAASRAGLVAVPINPAYQTKELEYCLNKVGIKALVMPSVLRNQNFYEMIRSIAPQLPMSVPGELDSPAIPSLKTIILLDDKKMNGVLTYSEIMSSSSQTAVQSISAKQRVIHADSPFTILFTSGTTGQPKAALLSHFAYTNNSWEMGFRNEFSEKNHKVCLQIPFFHAFGLLTAMGSLQHGISMVIPFQSYNAHQATKAIVQEKCTILTGTPTMYVDLVSLQKSEGFPINSVEIAITGGAPCSGQLAIHMNQYLGIQSIKSVYGMTEACVMFQSVPEDDIRTATDTVGQVCGHTEAKIIDSEGNTVPMGIPGELCIRSYANMQEYFGDPQKTAEIITNDNWLRTGDQLVLEDSGYGKIAGRLKDIIIRGGENIFPKEIEDFLNTHPDIIESHVFGVKDDRLGEEICASIRIRDGADIEYNKLKKFCEGAIAHFKIPRHLRIVDKFPVTPSGKIQKFKLKEMVESGQL